MTEKEKIAKQTADQKSERTIYKEENRDEKPWEVQLWNEHWRVVQKGNLNT